MINDLVLKDTKKEEWDEIRTRCMHFSTNLKIFRSTFTAMDMTLLTLCERCLTIGLKDF